MSDIDTWVRHCPNCGKELSEGEMLTMTNPACDDCGLPWNIDRDHD